MNCPTQAQKGKAMHILIVEPGKHPRETDIDGSLESLQKTVGGYIQAIYSYSNREQEVAWRRYQKDTYQRKVHG